MNESSCPVEAPPGTAWGTRPFVPAPSAALSMPVDRGNPDRHPSRLFEGSIVTFLVAIRVLAQESNEDIVHILSSRPVSQWALCGTKTGHDWLVRQEDIDLSLSSLDFCGACRRNLWKELREESRAFPLQEQEIGTVRALWARLRAPFADSEPEKQPNELR